MIHFPPPVKVQVALHVHNKTKPSVSAWFGERSRSVVGAGMRVSVGGVPNTGPRAFLKVHWPPLRLARPLI